VRGNYIGTNINGTAGVPNVGSGLSLAQGTNTTVGGTGAGEGNLIAFNTKAGVIVGSATTSSSGNVIRGNAISSNGALGIDLFPTGATANDAGDADTGSNDLQNFPVLTSASSRGGSTSVAGTLHSTASGAFKLDFYATS